MPAGTHELQTGPDVGELQHAGFPAAIEKGKVILKKDTTIVKAGATISREVAGLLRGSRSSRSRSGSRCAPSWTVPRSTYRRFYGSTLDAPRADLARAAAHAVGLAVDRGIRPPEPPRLLARAHRRALGVALATGDITKETIEPLFGKAMREAAAVGRLTGH